MIHLAPLHKERIVAILNPYLHYDIRAYGSRVKGTHRTLSDLDLCALKPIPFTEYNALIEAFEESDLPFFVSVVEWGTLAEHFQGSIQDDLLSIDKW